jgi:hypothetical protein
MGRVEFGDSVEESFLGLEAELVAAKVIPAPK